LFDERLGLTRTLALITVLVVLVAAGAGAYFLTRPQSTSGSGPIVLSIVETDPVNQVDSFNPINITVSHGSTITLAVQNGDDEARTFEISALNVNQTIGSGAAMRMTFSVGQQPGVFQMYLPPTPPFGGYRASPAVTGYLIVT